jgi:hypothetical protein
MSKDILNAYLENAKALRERARKIAEMEAQNIPEEWRENFIRKFESLFSNNYPPEIVGELTKDVLFWCPSGGVISKETLRLLENLSKSKSWLHIKSEDVNCDICDKIAYKKVVIEDSYMVGIYEGHVSYTSYYYPPKGMFYIAEVIIKLDSEKIEYPLKRTLSKKFKETLINPEKYDRIIYEAFKKSASEKLNLCQKCGEEKNIEEFIREKINPQKYFPEISKLFDINPYVLIRSELHKHTPGSIF